MRKVILLLIIAISFICTASVQAAIFDVSVLPENPTDIDLISIFVSGGEASGPVLITDAVFDLDSFDITLDLTLEVGLLTIATPWDYTYDIGLLPEGIYGLTVNTLVPAMPSRNDTFITSFEVVPEPASIMLLGLGGLLLRRRS